MSKQIVGGVAALALVLGIVSCSLVEEIRGVGAEAYGRAVAFECGLSLDERQKNLAAINGWLNGSGVMGRAVAHDCDGDGAPDF